MKEALSRWLCPDDWTRARVLDNSPRVRRARTTASLGMLAALIYIAPTVTWWVLALFAASIVLTSTVDVRMRRSPRPELHAAFTVVASQAIMAVAIAITGGPRSPMVTLIVIPTVFTPTRFRPTVCHASTITAILLMLAGTLLRAPAATVAAPGEVLAALALLVGVNAATQALFDAEVQNRRRAVLDPLTGLLNRQSLESRYEELAQQARITGAPISLLVTDLDHFKAVNDRHGHATGDAVLREVAGVLRGQVRTFELIYRLGGEEFVIVLPGAGAEVAQEVAGRLCASVATARPQGIALTASVGCATAQPPELDWGTLFGAADRALYEAKHAGRNRTAWRAAGDVGGTTAPAAAAPA